MFNLLWRMGQFNNVAGKLDEATDEQMIKYFKDFGQLLFDIANKLETMRDEGRSPNNPG